MRVKVLPNNYQPTGVVSWISYSNKEFADAMRSMFHESEREQLVEVVIELDGIKALFETRTRFVKSGE